MGEGKIRLDHLVVQRGLADSGARAQALILAGKILAPGLKKVKAGSTVSTDQILERVETMPFVSRGGLKLDAAFTSFHLDVVGRGCVDIGASTGGFTDCLLQRGASKVLAVDVGHGQLHWSLRNDGRVINREKTHVLTLTEADAFLVAVPSLSLFVCVDVSFIGLEKVLPHLSLVFPEGTELVVLVKPQFEVGPKLAPKGVVRDPLVRQAAVGRVMDVAQRCGFFVEGKIESPVVGPEGNREFLLWMRKAGGI